MFSLRVSTVVLELAVFDVVVETRDIFDVVLLFVGALVNLEVTSDGRVDEDLNGTLETRFPGTEDIEDLAELKVQVDFGIATPLFPATLGEAFTFEGLTPTDLFLAEILGLTASMGGVGGGRIGALRLAGR